MCITLRSIKFWLFQFCSLVIFSFDLDQRVHCYHSCAFLRYDLWVKFKQKPLVFTKKQTLVVLRLCKYRSLNRPILVFLIIFFHLRWPSSPAILITCNTFTCWRVVVEWIFLFCPFNFPFSRVVEYEQDQTCYFYCTQWRRTNFF